MHCQRCQGLMINISMTELWGTGTAIVGWRCLLCGEATDPGIEANRTSHLYPARNRARVPGTPRATRGKGKW